MAGEYSSWRWTKGEAWTSYYFPMLPGAALNLDSVKINYELGIQYDNIYGNGEDSYLVTLWDMYRTENVTLTVPRTTDATRLYAGTYADDP